mmetsp:Transcript_48498/g.115447  ORF Transcript_48498/g.115447 Transcript_48498/m.115447 type:complete len:286 (-) Transcript_48498:1336-2193(-)
MYVPAHRHDPILSGVIREFDVSEGLVRHPAQRFGRPLGEPVDRAARDQGREVAEPPLERVADRRERQDDVEVALHPLEEALVHVLLCEGYALRRAEGAHRHGDLVVVSHVEDVWHLPRVEHAVNILEERLQHDLRIGEEEDGRLALLPRAEQHLLHILAPLKLPVPLGDLDRDALHVRREGRDARHGLPPRAADAEEERVALGLPQDAGNARDVPDRVHEHHELHRLVRLRVVLIQHRLHHFPARGGVRDLRVEHRVGPRDHVVPEHHRLLRHGHVPLLLEHLCE